MEKYMTDKLTMQHVIFFAAFLLLLFFSTALWKSITTRIKKTKDELWNGVIKNIVIPGYLVLFSLVSYQYMFLTGLGKTYSSLLAVSSAILDVSLVLFLGEAIFSMILRYYSISKSGHEFPSIFRQIIKGILYIIVVLSFLSNSYNIDITPLLTTSAVFTMVLGLALQDVLGNLFSGLSVHISPPFIVGDWIEINDYMGKVIESNWRATTLRLPSTATVIIPNNQIAKKEIKNFTDTNGNIFKEFEIGLSYEVSPERVRKVLKGACRQVKEIFTRPAPVVLLKEYDEYTINYTIRYWLSGVSKPEQINNKLASRVWYRLKRENISVPFPISDVHIYKEKDEHQRAIERRLLLISGIDFLNDIRKELKQFIAERLEECWYETGETIFTEGNFDTDFYLIDRGRVGIFISSAGSIPVAELKSGDFFGEMSLLTGAQRSATVSAETECLLLKLSKDTMGHLLSENSALAEKLSESLAQREAANQKVIESKNTYSSAVVSSRHEFDGSASKAAFLKRIRNFFKL